MINIIVVIITVSCSFTFILPIPFFITLPFQVLVTFASYSGNHGHKHHFAAIL
jgi:hypothetical protein